MCVCVFVFAHVCGWEFAPGALRSAVISDVNDYDCQLPLVLHAVELFYAVGVLDVCVLARARSVQAVNSR